MQSDTTRDNALPFGAQASAHMRGVEHLRRVDRLIEAALDLPREARERFLEQSCIGDAELERDAKRLLTSCEHVHDSAKFLEGTAAEMAAPVLADLSSQVALSEMSAVAELSSILESRYTVVREIGHGGMATVYLANDRADGRAVAVKVLRPELFDSTAKTRFEREIRLLARLEHPRIVPVLDVGEKGDVRYYVLPYMEGGSLRDRLRIEKQLPVADAVTLAVTIAEALDYAHQLGVVHRDVKPENILFSAGHPHVADFGTARVLDRFQGESSTTTGLVRGTVPYMSPEQAGGSHDLDGRSDVYSLGCVLYEMLAGMSAFVGPSPEAVLAQKLTHPPRGVRVYRPTVSPRLEAVIARALQIAPADRFRTAGELAHALHELTPEELSGTAISPVPPTELNRERKRRRGLLALAAGLLAIGGVMVARYGPEPFRRGLTPSRPDTTIIAVLPLERRASGASRMLDDDQLLHEALSWWRGIVLVDRFLVVEAARRRGPYVTSHDASALAASVGAGRYVRASIGSQGGVWRVYAALFDVGNSKALHQTSELVPDSLTGATATYARVASMLLLRGTQDDSATVETVSTNSLPAAQAMRRAQSALDEWDLAGADSAFQMAGRFDPEYARASLMLAQVRAWRGLPPDNWSTLANRASVNASRLSWKEAQLASALVLLASARYEDACGVYDQLRRRNEHDFAAWYGLGMCRTMDRAVVRDASSPSGWRFRSSYQRAVNAYATAFEILPAVHRGYERSAFEELLRILLLVGTDVVTGRGVDRDSAVYQGRPAWIVDGDTLALIPYPWQTVSSGLAKAAPPGFGVALDHQRKRFGQIAAGWSAAYPTSPGAKQAVAISLELLGDPRSIDTMRLASRLSSDRQRRLQLAATEVLLRVKFGTPSDVEQLRLAKALADSLLSLTSPTPVDAEVLAPLAALTGRCEQAERLARQAVPGPLDVPLGEHLAVDAQVLLARSALGCSAARSSPNLRDLAGAIARDLATAPPDQRALIDAVLLFRPALLGARLDSAVIDRIAGSTGHPLLRAARAFTRHDTAGVRSTLSGFRAEMRVSGSPWTPDMVYPGASLLTAVGDTVTAIEWLDEILNAVRSFDPKVLADPTRTAAFIRSTVLRADLANATHDSASARRWGAVAATLWRNADAELSAVPQRMMRYVRTP